MRSWGYNWEEMEESNLLSVWYVKVKKEKEKENSCWPLGTNRQIDSQ